MDEPFVSVIIAVRNGQAHIAACLDSVLSCDYGHLEVICIDDGSNDQTASILERYRSRVRVITHAVCQGPSAARNAAAAVAKGDFLAFTDGDCLVDTRWLRELMRCFDRTAAVAAGGSQAVPVDDTEFGKDIARCMGSLGFVTGYLQSGTTISPVDHNPSCNSIYRKQVFLDEGGFLPGLWPGEDVELDYRLRKKGLVIVFNPAAVVFHYRPTGLGSFIRAMKRYGWAQAVLVRKFGFFRPIQFFPLLILGVFAVTLGSYFLRWAPGLALLPALLFLGYAYFVVRARSIVAGMRYAWFALNICAAWTLGFCRGISAGTKGVR